MVAKIILISLLVMSLGYTLAKDGEPKEGTYNFGISLLAAFVYLILLLISWN